MAENPNPLYPTVDLQHPDQFKDSPLGRIPKEWDFAHLCEHIQLISGQHISSASYSEQPGGVPYITGPDDFPNGTIQATKYTKSPKVMCSPGDVIVTVKGSGVGKITIADAQYCISRQLMAIRSPSLDTRFTYWLLHSRTETIHASAEGLIPGVSRAILLSIPFGLPDIEEQRKIAEILDTVDATIRQTEALIAKLEQMKQGLLHDLLTRGIDDNGELRDPVRHPEQFKDSPLGRIPKEWEVKELQDYCGAEITYGIVQAGPHIEGGIPYIRTGDMSGPSLQRDGLLCTSRAIANSYKRSEVRSGEIVCSIRATVGTVLQVPSNLDGANLTQGTARIAPNSETSAQFLLWNLRSERVRSTILANIKGTTFREITLGSLRRILLAAPRDAKEQEQIASRLEDCDKQIHVDYAKRKKLSMVKTGLMDDLLTGRTRVNV